MKNVSIILSLFFGFNLYSMEFSAIEKQETSDEVKTKITPEKEKFYKTLSVIGAKSASEKYRESLVKRFAEGKELAEDEKAFLKSENKSSAMRFYYDYVPLHTFAQFIAQMKENYPYSNHIDCYPYDYPYFKTIDNPYEWEKGDVIWSKREERENELQKQWRTLEEKNISWVDYEKKHRYIFDPNDMPRNKIVAQLKPQSEDIKAFLEDYKKGDAYTFEKGSFVVKCIHGCIKTPNIARIDWGHDEDNFDLIWEKRYEAQRLYDEYNKNKYVLKHIEEYDINELMIAAVNIGICRPEDSKI